MTGGDSSDARLARILLDLDRCEHGRYSTDPCHWCPDGQSTGNLILPPGTVIGHGLDGHPIRIPQDRDQRLDVKAWRGGMTR